MPAGAFLAMLAWAQASARTVLPAPALPSVAPAPVLAPALSALTPAPLALAALPAPVLAQSPALLPAAALGALPREALRDPAVLGAVFDGSPTPKGAAVSAPGGELERLAAPFRTERQLARLAAEPRARGETFTFAVVGDAEPGRFWWSRRLYGNPGVFWDLLARLRRRPVDFVVQLGDMVSRGRRSHYLRFFRGLTLARLRAPYLSVIGNHDRRRPHGVSDGKLYAALFGPADYSFDRGPARFVVLDTSAGRLTRAQLDWLDRQLDTDKLKVVFTHMAPGVVEFTDFGPLGGAGGFKKGAEAFAALVSRRGVSRVYAGHVHAFARAEHLGVQYVLTGGGGSPLFPSGVAKADRFHHYLTVTVGPDGVRETVHRVDGPADQAAAPSRSARRSSGARPAGSNR